MPVNSPNYPPGGFSTRTANVQAVGAMTGRLVDDNGGVTGLAARQATMAVGHLLWEGMAYLDVIEIRTQQIPALRQSLDSLSGAIQQLSNKLDFINSQLTSLGVTIPSWTTRDGVVNGEFDDMGFPIPSATQLGLIVEFNVIQDPGGDQTPGKVFAIDPPAGSFVSRGTHVLVTVNYESDV